MTRHGIVRRYPMRIMNKRCWRCRSFRLVDMPAERALFSNRVYLFPQQPQITRQQPTGPLSRVASHSLDDPSFIFIVDYTHAITFFPSQSLRLIIIMVRQGGGECDVPVYSAEGMNINFAHALCRHLDCLFALSWQAKTMSRTFLCAPIARCVCAVCILQYWAGTEF